VSAGEESLLVFGQKAREHGIRLSLHTQYYISLSGVDPEKRLKSIDYIEKSLWAADLMGADTIVIHSGSAGKIPRAEAMKLSCDTLEQLLRALDGRYEHIRLGIETMGKLNQLGTLDEVIEQCRVSPRFVPVVDFGHLNCREVGNAFPDVDSYRRVFDRIANTCGDHVAKSLHCHFSKIEYTEAGEKKHLTFQDTVFGPRFEPLAEAIIKDNLAPRIICESDGTQAEDALWMKHCVRELGGRVRPNHE
jgi:deoxyribonuclease-4